MISDVLLNQCIRGLKRIVDTLASAATPSKPERPVREERASEAEAEPAARHLDGQHAACC